MEEGQRPEHVPSPCFQWQSTIPHLSEGNCTVPETPYYTAPATHVSPHTST